MTKILSYILMLLGLALIAIKLWFGSLLEKIPLLASLDVLWTIIIGAVLIVLGFLLLRGKKKLKGEEVPIYRGKKIVGYRRK